MITADAELIRDLEWQAGYSHGMARALKHARETCAKNTQPAAADRQLADQQAYWEGRTVTDAADLERHKKNQKA